MTEMVEIEEFKHTLDKFGRESGLMVNPVKYTMWFSKRCFEACRRDILAAFEAKCTGLKKEYLGIGIPTNRRVVTTHVRYLQRNVGVDLRDGRLALSPKKGGQLSSNPYLSPSPSTKCQWANYQKER
jgi:hypothetical protein